MHRRIILAIIVNILLNTSGCCQVSAGEYAKVAVVAGDFLYEQTGSTSDMGVQYQVRAESYQGIPAWKVYLNSPDTVMELYIRRDDSKPLYLRQTSHALHQTVEIQYGTVPGEGILYRRSSLKGDYRRTIKAGGLIDLGMLPQLLLGESSQGLARDVHFRAIDYQSGDVYNMVAVHAGFARLPVRGQEVLCAIYDIKIDAWLSILCRRVRIAIPVEYHFANFVSYEGPTYSGGGEQVSLRLSEGTQLAVNKR